MSHDERERNRREFPTAAAVMDEFRSVFGPEVRLRWWYENGKSIGKIPENVRSELEEESGAHKNDQAGVSTLREHGAARS